MNRNQRFVEATITIDTSRPISKNESGIALLYDPVRKCYYRTTLEDIVLVTTKKMNEELAQLRAEFQRLSSDLKSEQSKFIEDTTKNIDAIIKLTEGEQQ